MPPAETPADHEALRKVLKREVSRGNTNLMFTPAQLLALLDEIAALRIQVTAYADGVEGWKEEVATLRAERDDLLRRHDEHKRNLLDGLDRYEEQVQTLERERDAARGEWDEYEAALRMSEGFRMKTCDENDALRARVAAAERLSDEAGFMAEVMAVLYRNMPSSEELGERKLRDTVLHVLDGVRITRAAFDATAPMECDAGLVNCSGRHARGAHDHNEGTAAKDATAPARPFHGDSNKNPKEE